jgi:hypothetical protein
VHTSGANRRRTNHSDFGRACVGEIRPDKPLRHPLALRRNPTRKLIHGRRRTIQSLSTTVSVSSFNPTSASSARRARTRSGRPFDGVRQVARPCAARRRSHEADLLVAKQRPTLESARRMIRALPPEECARRLPSGSTGIRPASEPETHTSRQTFGETLFRTRPSSRGSFLKYPWGSTLHTG